MNRREKLLALGIGGILGVFLVGFGLQKFIAAPLQEIDKRTAGHRDKLARIQAERRAFFEAEDRVKAHALRTFADTVDQASAKSGALLTQQILQSGLREDEFTRLPVGPRKIRGAEEIGWNVAGDGPLADVIDLLFMLQTSPYLHRIENLSLSAGESPAMVKVRFRYLTLVMQPASEVTRTELAARYTLESPERHLLDGITTRDFLRPYLKRPPPPPPSSSPPGAPSSLTQPGSAPGPENYRIVSLSEWMGQPEIHIRDLTQQKTVRYQSGDALAGGTIVGIDYRPLPMPGNALLRSDSRVLLRIGADYWAIERGKTLADKRRLATNELPEQLAKNP